MRLDTHFAIEWVAMQPAVPRLPFWRVAQPRHRPKTRGCPVQAPLGGSLPYTVGRFRSLRFGARALLPRNSPINLCSRRAVHREAGSQNRAYTGCKESMKNTKFVVRLNRSGVSAPQYVQRIDRAPIQTTSNRKLALMMGRLTAEDRSEERRVGKECRSRWSPYQ